MTDWMTAVEAAAELGVKQATLYAYVSRGVLHSEREPGKRESRFRRTEVERVAGRRRQRASGGEIVVDSGLTLLDPAGQLYFRGRDVTELVRAWPYERVAEWLWSGIDAAPARWTTSPAALRAGRRAQDSLGPAASLADRLRGITAAVATTDPLRHDRRPAAVAATARGLIAALVDCLPEVGRAAPPGASLARRLWPRLSAKEAKLGWVAALDTALGLLADHEMAASTFAARVAASTWADPYLVVQAGMAALGGPLHGGASREVRALVREAVATSPEHAVGAGLRGDTGLPGMGHRVYVGPDPRARVILEAIERARPPAAVHRASQGILAAAASHGGPLPNVDFAIAVLEESAAMPEGAGEAIFAIARTAGWIAHAIEEYDHRLRYRPRAAYTGPR